jgi:predicted ATPase/5S rRNA maturation endonuclease (ribonuclease M5)
MKVEMTIKNYRCFPDSKPARIVVQRGFVAFVGVNNSGKSSILKFFYEFRDLLKTLSSPSGSLFVVLGGPGQAFKFPGSVLDPEEVFSNLNNRDIEVEILLPEIESGADNASIQVARGLALRIAREGKTWTAEALVGTRRLRGMGAGWAAKPRDKIMPGLGNKDVDFSRVFEACATLSNTLYVGAFRNAINLSTNLDYFDIRIGEDFAQMWRSLKTGNIKKEIEATVRLTEEIKGIFGYDRLEINQSMDGRSLQLIINGKGFKLAEVGSGFTQFLVVLVNAAIKRPSYLLIDEPELNLHPTLQLDFLTTLASYTKEGILFCTQSLGLARAAADKIYSVRKLAEGESEVADYESTPRLAEFLGELSFSGYKELGFDKILLVEGRTDVKTIQQFLRFYKKEHQVVILPLGGSQLINEKSESELQEVKRISANILVLIDSERDAAGGPLHSERAAFVERCRHATISCHVLDRRAIENYLSDRAVKMIKGSKYRALQPYQKLKDVSPAWGKEENWRIARVMSIDDLRGTDLGKFLDSI